MSDDFFDRSPEMIQQQVEQLGNNCKWLIAQMDLVHACLCPGQNGTWQERVKQVVKAARHIQDTERS